jgi:iron-sulfur cluster repair protein YtfE (RIC family)
MNFSAALAALGQKESPFFKTMFLSFKKIFEREKVLIEFSCMTAGENSLEVTLEWFANLDEFDSKFTIQGFNRPMKTEFELSLPALLHFIKESCHENLHLTLIDLRDIVQGSEIPEDSDIIIFIKDFIQRLQIHLIAEEIDLFPFFETPHLGGEVYSIHNLMKDHAQFNRDLAMIRWMTNDFELSGDINERRLDIYGKLIELERIIKNHIQLENSLLYPIILKTI